MHGPNRRGDMAKAEVLIGSRIEDDDNGVAGNRCLCPYCNGIFELKGNSTSAAVNQLTCKRCGFEWGSRKGDPLKCPKCGSYSWNKVAVKCRCHVCGHDWTSRRPEGPSRCPSCNSNRWNEVPHSVQKVVKEENPTETRDRWVLDRYNSGKGCLAIASELGLPLMRVMRVVSESLKLDVAPRI